ncbi:hypothetical protein [Bradyrhizobium sp. WSM1417]|uniref:hypothetical protein n=1 Tax=Bradyrhizobium sp. WSM1417 TaxID=754500 RepID=UPI000686D42C|nr:hypothetical protein [Bradyrhizobium sp. WSM1417]
MNAELERLQTQTVAAMPTEIEAMRPPPQLLPGESIDHYHNLQAAVLRDINPRSAIEWLLAFDIAELSWEMLRYRVLRNRLLSTYRQKAIETMLRRVDVAGIAPALQDLAEIYTIKNALDWRLDPSAALDIEARLGTQGYDQYAISMEVYVQARETLPLFDSLLNGAQLRRLLLLKEVNNLRRTRVDVRVAAERQRRSKSTGLARTPGR